MGRNKNIYDREYTKKYLVRKNMLLSKKNDKDILDYLEEHKDERFSTFVKRLIREEIEKNEK